MEKVQVTVDMGRKTVALEKVTDVRIRSALAKMAENVGQALAKVKCPEHQQSPTAVRLHMSMSGNADLKYESCCEKLRDVVSKAL